MEPNSSQENVSYMLEIPEPVQKPSIVLNDKAATLAPVIIEELDETQMSMMEIDRNEFIEAHALEVCEVGHGQGAGGSFASDDLDVSDSEDLLSVEEENRLMKRFLNGELTFSEYSCQMGDNIETEITEIEIRSDATEKPKSQPSTSLKTEGPKKIQRRGRKRNLPAALQGLMGEANIRFAEGETGVAVQMCMEIIRQAPFAPEPFRTLANIYEYTDPIKALQFELIAAHLSPRNAEQWVKLAEDSLKSTPQNIKQAITCYTKAIQASPKDFTLYRARAKLQEEIGDCKALQRSCLRFVSQLGPNDGDILMEYAKDLTKMFMEEENYQQALHSMELIFTKCPNLVTFTEVNIICDILIALEKFHRCLDILNEYTEVCVKFINRENVENTPLQLEICKVPENFNIDLRVKLILCLIRLHCINEVNPYLDKLLDEFYGDLYLDIVDALMTTKKYEKAIKFLHPLVGNPEFSMPAVWLRYAECWVGCKDLKRAILCYEIVTKLSPQHFAARLQLSSLYKCFGQYDAALKILTQDEQNEIVDAEILYHKTLLLYKLEKYDEFLKFGQLLINRHCVNLRSRDELTVLTRSSVRQRIEALHTLRFQRAESLDDDRPMFNDSQQPSLQDEFKLFLKMCRVACRLKKFGVLERMCFTALTSKRFEPKTQHLNFLCLLACIYNKNSYYAYNLVRDMVRDCDKSAAWNLLDIVIQQSDDCRHNRFLMRQFNRQDVFSIRNVLNANNCLVSGTYKYALNDYVSLFRLEPNSMLALLVAVTFLQMACQKFSAKKHRLINQAYAFFKKYEQMRGPEGKQEANYNIGRALHQLGLLSGALYFYKLVLESPVPKLVQDNSDRLDLKKEAAFNIHLIYMYSGNFELAKIYLDDYIVI